MTEEKIKEINEKILKTLSGGPSPEAIENFTKIATDYVDMINETITPMNPLTAPIIVAALGYMYDVTASALDSEGKSAAKMIKMLLKLTTRAVKVDLK